MAVAFICDHCGETYNKNEGNNSPIGIFNREKRIISREDGLYDICPNCTQLLEEFVHYKRSEE